MLFAWSGTGSGGKFHTLCGFQCQRFARTILRQQAFQFQEFHAVEHLVKQTHAFFQRFAEAAFFRAQGFHNLRLFFFQLGICTAHRFHQIGHEFVEKRLFLTEFVTVAHGAADDAAQYIAAAFVGRHHAVGNQEGAGADVVGNDFQARFVHAERRAGFAGNGFEQVLEQVDFVVAVNMLHHGRHALQAHAGIDGRLGQRVHVALLVAVELHEHAVPNFNPAVAVFFGAAGNAAPDFFAVVVENF